MSWAARGSLAGLVAGWLRAAGALLLSRCAIFLSICLPSFIGLASPPRLPQPGLLTPPLCCAVRCCAVLRRRTEVDLPGAAFGFFHDFLATPSHYVFLESPSERGRGVGWGRRVPPPAAAPPAAARAPCAAARLHARPPAPRRPGGSTAMLKCHLTLSFKRCRRRRSVAGPVEDGQQVHAGQGVHCRGACGPAWRGV